jgi:hypothetical protein
MRLMLFMMISFWSLPMACFGLACGPSGLQSCTQPSGGAPGAVMGTPFGPAGLPGCPGEIAELTREALLVGLCEHVALPLAGELAGEVGVGEHGCLLSAAGLGREVSAFG